MNLFVLLLPSKDNLEQNLRNTFYSHTPKSVKPHETGQFGKKKKKIVSCSYAKNIAWMTQEKNKKFKVITEIKTFIFSSEKQIPQKAKLVLQRSKIGHPKTSLALDYF